MVKVLRGARTCHHYYSKLGDVGKEMTAVGSRERWSQIKVTRQGLWF